PPGHCSSCCCSSVEYGSYFNRWRCAAHCQPPAESIRPTSIYNMRPLIPTLLACLLLVGPCCAIASADGGRVVLSQRQDNYQITVFVAPDPLRAGPVDISLMLQDTASGQPIAEAQIDVSLTPRNNMSPIVS